jgi:hypothetical protein
MQVGISRKLSKLNKELAARDAFVPHGQCAHVHVGGHAHSGGYGLPGRAFGLFGDHITAIRVITADGPDGGASEARWIERGTADPQEAQLFWAVLGGSPGNFAVLTHIRLKVRDGCWDSSSSGVPGAAVRLLVPAIMAVNVSQRHLNSVTTTPEVHREQCRHTTICGRGTSTAL